MKIIFFTFLITLITVAAELDCEADEFECDDGSCIPLIYRCDGIVNCPNEDADEMHCGDDDYYEWILHGENDDDTDVLPTESTDTNKASLSTDDDKVSLPNESTGDDISDVVENIPKGKQQ